MSENRNLGVGILLGLLLTTGLMFGLYLQSGFVMPIVTQATVPPEPQILTSPFVPAVAPSPQPQQVQMADNTSVVDETPLAALGAMGSDSVPATEAEPAMPVKQAVEPAEAVLPKELLLSAQELDELSAAERAQYAELVQALRAVQLELSALDNERDSLQQRMDHMFEENTVLEREVEKIRTPQRAAVN